MRWVLQAEEILATRDSVLKMKFLGFFAFRRKTAVAWVCHCEHFYYEESWKIDRHLKGFDSRTYPQFKVIPMSLSSRSMKLLQSSTLITRSVTEFCIASLNHYSPLASTSLYSPILISSLEKSRKHQKLVVRQLISVRSSCCQGKKNTKVRLVWL